MEYVKIKMVLNRITKYYTCVLICMLGCCFQLYAQENFNQIAFIADAHFADVYPDLSQEDFKAIQSRKYDTSILIRSMSAQLHSTRLFNENYFALKAALDDVVRRGIKLVAMPGDFSDDGQPIHIHGLRKLLQEYTEKYDLSFFLAPGNHDPTRPFGKASGETDFLGSDGRSQPVMSLPDMYNSNSETEHPTAILKGMQEGGYATVVDEMAEFGFVPKSTYHFWSTPFSNYSYTNYAFDKAKTAAQIVNRSYTLAPETPAVPDVSYLVEPIEGLWLLSLDANVYTYDQETMTFGGSGIGYNEVLKYKKHLIDWTSGISKEANRLGKKLITFSHYPMVDFNDGASEEMIKVFGKQAFQAYRNPSQKVGEIFANAGLKIHVGGHMHLNDTGIIKSKEGNTLVNIQIPSLAAYPPAYKILTFTEANSIAVETVVLNDVANFDSFFPWYDKEHDFLTTTASPSIWDKTILSTDSYAEYTEHHLTELIKLRLLSSDFPTGLVKILSVLNGWELFVLSYLSEEHASALYADTLDKTFKLSPEWQKAVQEASKALQKTSFTKEDYQLWNGNNFILDFYKLRNGDQIALETIPDQRIHQYKFWFSCLSAAKNKSSVVKLLQNFTTIFSKQLDGEPSINFEIDLGTGEVITK